MHICIYAHIWANMNILDYLELILDISQICISIKERHISHVTELIGRTIRHLIT